MARVVEAVIPSFGDAVTYEKIITTKFEGATKYTELSKKMGRLPPVPSIFIGGELIFEQTPGQEELKECIVRLLSEGPLKD
jgi:hypothetical protein